MFTQHHSPSQSWPEYLADYTLLGPGIVEARPESAQDNRIRTLIYRAQPNTGSPPEVAIKVVPLEVEGKIAWATGEMRIHYFLSQNDAEAVRLADDSDKSLFRVEDKADLLNVDKAVQAKILDGKSWNIVPLFDFAVRSAVITIPASAETRMENLRLPPVNSPATFLTMKYFNETVAQHVGRLGLVDKIKMLHDVMAQLCAVLHQLMAIRFTHGDLKLENVAYIPTDDGDKITTYHKLADDKMLVLADQTGYFAMFDFGFATMRVTDANGTRWKPKHIDKVLSYRFGDNSGITETQLFAPVVDLYQITEAVCVALAQGVKMADSDYTIDQALATNGAVVQNLKGMVQAVLDKVPAGFKTSPLHEALSTFADALGDNTDNIKTTADGLISAQKTNSDAWISLYKSLPPTEDEILELAVPWDVLSSLWPGPLKDSKDPPDGSKNMTLKPVIGPGKRYTGAQYSDDASFRLAPLGPQNQKKNK